MSKKRETFIPALKYERLTLYYDPLLRWVMREASFKARLIQQAALQPEHRILDLGCGTATLTIMAKKAHPQTRLVGLDADMKVLRLAQGKAAKDVVDIDLLLGTAFQLPYADNSFDRVLSSLVFHHLTTDSKQRTLQEVHRVLRPGGELHIVDFGKPHGAFAYVMSHIMRRLEHTTDNVKGRLPEMFRQAGLEQVSETARYLSVFGTPSQYQGRKPAWAA